MSMKKNLYFLLISFAMIANTGYSQTIELGTSYPGSVTLPGNGPSISNIAAIPLKRDVTPSSNNTSMQNIGSGSPDYTTVSMRLSNQQYTGLTYSNVQTGLLFGASPTTATDLVTPATPTQRVDPLPIFNNLGYFDISPGGPTDGMFTVSPSNPAGTGIVANPQFVSPQPEVNGAISVFTAAQVQFDRPGGPSVHNTATRYYYGDLVIDLNRFVANPVLHIAGLGGSYRYFNSLGAWQSTYFTTELEIVGFNGTKLSGNSFLVVSGSNITNNATAPSGASVSTVGSGTIFDEIGAATGSVRIVGTARTITLRVYLRGSNSSQFPWSTLQANVPGANRNPFTGDIWWISVSASQSSLIPLPATGLTLTGSLSNNNVSLNWKTLSEINTKDFQIQKSSDGINFTSIASLPASGNSPTESRYSYIDGGMTSAIQYYRIKLVDIDGKESYSNTIVIRQTGSVKMIKAFPNPATGPVNIEFSNMKGSYTVNLHNLAGQIIHTQKAEITGNVQYVVVNRGQFTAGAYLLKVVNNVTQETTTERIILQ